MAAPTTEFKVVETNIPGLLIFHVSNMEDSRGWFQEKYHRAKLIAAGLPESFTAVQTNISFNKQAGVIRGYHAEPWDKYISMISGRAFCAYVDLRKRESFGQVVTVELDMHTAVFVPRGVANSFQTLDTNSYYFYNTNDHWSETAYSQQYFVNLADPEIKVNWPIPLNESTMSDRDKQHPLLSQIQPLEL